MWKRGLTALGSIFGIFLLHYAATMAAMWTQWVPCAEFGMFPDDPRYWCPIWMRVSSALLLVLLQPMYAWKPIRRAVSNYSEPLGMVANSLFCAVAIYGLLLLAGRIRARRRARLADRALMPP